METKEANIPLSIFNNNKLSALESIVKCLKENLNLKFSEIAKLLLRNSKTIWSTYNKAKNKMEGKLILKESKTIPLSIFRPRFLSVLESLVEFLKKEYKMSFHEIAVALNRDDRTIWTVYKRAEKKRRL